MEASFSDMMEDLLNSNNENGLRYGFYFNPSPFEILQYYLVPKLKSEGLPEEDHVKDLDVYQYDPERIPMDEPNYAGKDQAYFFVPITAKHLQGKDNLTRTTPNGYWKVSKGYVPIDGRDGAIIGYMNKLEFYYGKDPDGIKTDWKMVEYRTKFRVNGNMESCMVCKVRLKVQDEFVPDDEAEASGDESHSSEETETK